jgi:hypothetical protein
MLSTPLENKNSFPNIPIIEFGQPLPNNL